VKQTATSVFTDRVTIKGGVIDLKPGNSMLDLGMLPLVKAIPTAPEECIFPLRNNVTGLPVMNGVEDAMRPSLNVWVYFNLVTTHITLTRISD